MSSNNGTIVLMGSGELTATMVEVHKTLLASLGQDHKAVFLDTPAGFQPNVDQISGKAVEYFRTKVECSMDVASFKSKEKANPVDLEKAFQKLREAQYILIGPGSPTYAVRQWLDSPIPKILTSRIEQGGCLVAASAAALTVGCFTLPVYELYKVGEELHWVKGIDILGRFGFNLVVVPHWNNAEGGTHDTRFCFMGEQRFRMLESLLSDDAAVLGLEEHTACVIDIGRGVFSIKGIGRVILRQNGGENVFLKGEAFPVDILQGRAGTGRPQPATKKAVVASKQDHHQPFWGAVHDLEHRFNQAIEGNDVHQAAQALLDLDYTVWKGSQDLESEECIAQAREILRELLVLLATTLETLTKENAENLNLLVEALLRLRNRLREDKQWEHADAIRRCLEHANIVVEDTPNETRWRVKSP